MKENKKIVKISTYARDNNLSVQWVYKLIEKGELTLVEIDGMKFVQL